jgi:hypothetical protein
MSSVTEAHAARNGVGPKPAFVTKRDGRKVPFDQGKIFSAVKRCSTNGTRTPEEKAQELAGQIARAVVNVLRREGGEPGVEHVQRIVVQQLWAAGRFEEAEHYQNYREERRKAREEQPVAERFRRAVAEDAAHFPTPLQHYQFLSKFARFRDDLGRRETWREACERVMAWFRHVAKKYRAEVTDEEWQLMGDCLYEMEAACALRVLQMAGPALERCELGAYNCATLPIDCLEAFAELLYDLMQGSGCSFSVEAEFIDKLPRIKKQKTGPARAAHRHKIVDSTEGWCDAWLFGLRAWFGGEDVEFDPSGVRPAGARLKIKGGRASGPAPLLELLNFSRKVILSRQGGRLTDLDVHDLCCMGGKIVQVGGVRRASALSHSDLDSTLLRDAKSGPWYQTAPWRTMANNSAVYHERPDAVTFMEEWLALAKSGSGERGIFNLTAVYKHLPARRKKVRLFVNPCFAGETLVVTREGAVPIKDLVGREAEIFDGDEWRRVGNFRVTGRDQDMLKVTLQDGATLRVTGQHTMVLEDGSLVEAQDLAPGDCLRLTDVTYDGPIHASAAYLKGFLLGDGTLINERQAHLWLYEPKYCCKGRLLASAAELPLGPVRTNANPELGWRPGGADNRLAMTGLACRGSLSPWCDGYRTRLPVEVFCWGAASKAELLAGLFDADGTVSDSDHGFSYQLSSVRPDFLRDVQTLLKSVGVRSKVALAHRAQRRTMPGGDYDCQACWRLSVSQAHSVKLAGLVKFSRLPDFSGRAVAYQCQPRAGRVVAVEADGNDATVYCLTVPRTHRVALAAGVVTGQCAEILIRACGLCNLSIAVARHGDTEATLARKVRAATLFGKLQSLCTDFRYVRDVWAKNCVEERLLGVDITGHADCPLLRYGAPGRAGLLERLGRVVDGVDVELSARWGINRSAASRCVKPSGDSAVLFGCASGVSPWFADFALRRVRQAVTDPVTQLLKDAGVPWAVAPEDESLVVFEFPRQAPPGATTRDDLTAVQQLENWLEWKRHWAEHSVSATIYVDAHEWLEVGNWVYAHFDDIVSLAFLPKDNGHYTYAPNEELTREEYERRVAEFPNIDWAKLVRYEKEDCTVSAHTYACTGDACERA